MTFIRDLRRTGATEAASAGATPLELMAVGGWANQASIRPYLVQTVEQAASVQAKRDAYRGNLGISSRHSDMLVRRFPAGVIAAAA
jgi:hypothetical protein